jgi:uncharacterized iron-regulated protein
MWSTRKVCGLAVFLLAVAAPSVAQSPDRIFRLSIGDPGRRDRDLPVVLDGITAAATGDVITPGDLPQRLEDIRLLLLGESHTSLESHRVQLRVIQALYASGRKVMIGLEMFPYTEQRALDQWGEGYYTEEGFVRLARWYEFWGYNWRYYRDIFNFARDHGIPMIAVNTPRETVAAVRKKGFTNLTPEEAARLPPQGVDVDSADHMTFFKSSFDEDDSLHGGMTEEGWKSMLSAQATWDAAMGWNAVQSLKQAKDPRAIMVVLVGSGHVAYDVGIVRQARRWFEGGIATLIPVPVAIPGPAVAIERVRASYADFVWGVLPDHDATFPMLGISTAARDDGTRVVIAVEDDSPAARAGFQVKDIVLSMDGQPITDRETLNLLVGRKTWGDAARIVVRRGTDEQALTAYFRRSPPRVIVSPHTRQADDPPATPDRKKRGGREE